jgi:hypothetical protein
VLPGMPSADTDGAARRRLDVRGRVEPDGDRPAPIVELMPLFTRLEANIHEPGEMQHRQKAVTARLEKAARPDCLSVDRY